MSRQKYQRPEVYATGRREKLWKAEWREYFIGPDGREHSRHKSKTWSRANYTKSEAQSECDRMMRELQQGAPKADGSMSLESFWKEIYYPVYSPQWAFNTLKSADSLWKLYIQPALGGKRLDEITKASIQLMLAKMAPKKGRSLVDGVRMRLHAVLEEAVDNDFIAKNPCRKIETPPCKPTRGVRSLTEDEVRQLWDKTEGRDYLLWRIMILTGARIGETLALTRSDVLSIGLRIDESALNAQPSTTKNKKTRLAPVPASLREELEEWMGGHASELLFTTPTGKMHRHSDEHMMAVVERARAAAGIHDLTFRMCRTTFATLFEGDIRDAQEILGHHSAQFTLEHYRKPITARQQDSVENLDRRLKVVPIKKPGAA